MYIKRNINWGIIFRFSWRNTVFFTFWSGLVFAVYFFLGWRFIDVPFEPISLIGIAVAFYIGFKNSQSYDRFWEARKIWGGIVNYSRTWANQVLNLVNGEDPVKLKETHKIMIYRHLAWVNALRIQLRQPNSFSLRTHREVESLFDRHGERNPTCRQIDPFVLEEGELDDLDQRKNIATHLVKNQGDHLKKLREKGAISEFDNLQMYGTLEQLYNLQGQCERIKNTPFPRQFAYFSTLFTWIFKLLVPFGLLSIFEGQFNSLRTEGQQEIFLLLLIPFSVLICWVFDTMEKVGSNTEDPFEGRINDVPMTALSRTIEIDLRDMLDEENLPKKVAPKDNILY